MAKKVIQMYDKYKSTTKIYPKVIKDCLQEDVTEYIQSLIPEAIPSIEIALSQITDLTTIQLTDAQFEILENNPCVFLSIENTTSPAFFQRVVLSDSTISFVCNAGSVNPDRIVVYQLYIGRATKIAEYEQCTISGGKQLYAHNIREVLSSGTEMRYEYSCLVINDSPTAFNRGTFKTYLEGKTIHCTGWFTHKNTGYNDGLIVTLTASSGTNYYSANLVKFDSGVFTVGTAQQPLAYAGTFTDDVVTL